jgi:hypothetical protein
MKMKSWADKQETDSEDQLYGMLDVCAEHGDFHLSICDKKGEIISGGHILSVDFMLRGILLNDRVNPDVGLRTDFDGYVLIMTQEELRDKLAQQEKSDFLENILRQRQQQKMQQQQETFKH